MRRFVSVAALVMATICSSCGGGSNSMNNNLSAAQAQAVSQQVVAAVTTALGNSLGVSLPSDKPRPSLGAILAHPDASSGCTSNSNGESCNFPLSYAGACSGGGTISVAGDVSGSLNNSGSGSIDAQITVTPASCSVSGTTFNGDPNVSITGQLAFTNSGPTFPMTFSEGGGISYGPNPSGSCQLNVTYSINSISSCTVTGTVCGQSVSGAC